MTSAHPSVQLYSVRDAIALDLPGALKRVADIGFKNVELYNFVDRYEEYRAALADNGLAAPTAHAKLAGQELEPIFTAAQALGITTVIDPHIDEARWTSRESIASIAADLNAAATAASAFGLNVGYHNHAFELEILIDGVPALEILAEYLDEGVLLEVDTYWAAVGGQDVVELLGRLGSRVQFLHVKDGPLTKNDKEQQAVGQGKMPVGAILEARPSALRIVELDDFDGDVFDALVDSYSYLTAGANA